MEISLSNARARLPELLDRVSEGEVIHITRHGKPSATLVDHDRWVKTQTHDVLITAQQIRRDIEAARENPRAERLSSDPERDAEAHVAEIRAGREVDAWDRAQSRD